jgi:hypothetical protein
MDRGADQMQRRPREEDSELVLVQLVLVGHVMADLGQAPSIRALDERKMLQ